MFAGVEGENFLSFAKFKFTIKKGITLLEGWNYDDETPEGAGKTAIPSAIYWCLTGELPKDANIDDVIREGQKGCRVALLLDDGTQIVRSRKPNDLYINTGTDKIKGKDAKETQQIIYDLIGMSGRTFLQSVYFAQNYPGKFITANEADKAKILSEIQDLSPFDRARKETVNLIKLEKDSITSLEQDIGHFETMRANTEKTVNDYTNLKAKLVKDREVKVASLVSELAVLQREKEAKTEKLKAAEAESESTQTEITKREELVQKYTEASAETKMKIKNLSKDKEELESLNKTIDRQMKALEGLFGELEEAREVKKDKACPTCGTLLSKANPESLKKHHDKITEQINAKAKEIEELQGRRTQIVVSDVSELEQILSDLDSKRISINQEINPLRKALTIPQSVRMELDNLVRQIARIQTELESERSKGTAQVDGMIEETEKELVRYTEQVRHAKAVFNTKMKYFDDLNVLKDSFKEIKSSIFNSLLGELSARANTYLNALFNQEVKIKFSNIGEAGEIAAISVDVTIDGSTRSLGLYSGGQARRIQLAVDLALSDIVQKRVGKSINLLILDEPFKDLSENSMERIIGFLGSLKKSIILIEHNSAIKSIVSNVVKVELSDGISQIVSGQDNADSEDEVESKMNEDTRLQSNIP